MEILLQIQLKCENCIEWNIFLYDLIMKCYGIREKMTYVAAHKLRSGPSSAHKLFYSHYGNPVSPLPMNRFCSMLVIEDLTF